MSTDSNGGIVCPKCGTPIDLDAIASERYNAQLALDRKRLEAEMIARKEEWMKKAEAIVRENLLKEQEVERRDLEARVAELTKRSLEANEQELALRKKSRELEEALQKSDIENARRLDEERKKIEAKYEEQSKHALDERMRAIQEEYARKSQEDKKQMEILQRSLEEANRKAQQGSMQIQGEVREDELKLILRQAFPMDSIEDVATGVRGADLVHTIRDGMGHSIGTILWESKNTKTFDVKWTKKLRDDQVRARADICVIVTVAMPDDTKQFALVGGVWVCDVYSVVPLASVLRDTLQTLHRERRTLDGRAEKKDLLYDYLSSVEFRAKIENVIDAFRTMKEDIETEKRSMSRIWAKREKELDRVIGNTTLFFGDMQGIMGSALPTPKYLELPGGEDDAMIPHIV